MNKPELRSPSQAEPDIAEIFRATPKRTLEVSEERVFDKDWLSLGDITLVTNQTEDSALIKLVRRGGFEWQLPSLDETIAKVVQLLNAKAKDDKRKVDDKHPKVRAAMDQVASIATRVGLIHPRFDPVAIEEMPFHQSTSVVADTSGVLQGALDFVARFLHPAARVKIPAITHMEIANMADRFLSIRRDHKQNSTPAYQASELTSHLTSQGGQRALLRLELRSDIEVERTYLLGDPLRAAFRKDRTLDLNHLDISSPIRSYADRLIVEAARHHQAQSGPAHLILLLTSDQGLARMARIEGVKLLYFAATKAADVFGQRLAGQTFNPFSGYIQRIPLTALLWELATAFGSARLSGDDGRTFQVSALGEQELPWGSDHLEQDLLWRTQQHSPSKSRKQIQPPARSVKRSTSPLRFDVERMFQLVCALDDHQEMLSATVEDVVRANGTEYRRFLQSGQLIELADGVWKASSLLGYLSADLRNERVEKVRKVLCEVPSFAAFAKRLGDLTTGNALDAVGSTRGLATYRTLCEVTLLCATVAKEIYATPNVPEVAAFSRIALHHFSSLDQAGGGLVATGEWLESLIRDEGIHPEVARRLLDDASEAGLLRRSTEGSTTQLRFDDRIVHVLRTDSGLPIVVPIYLYRGDYLIPGKASVSLRIEDPAV